MGLKLYREFPWSSATELTPADQYIGTGSKTTFTLFYKEGTALGGTIQAGATQYYQYTQGFTKNGNDFTLSSAPPLNSQIVAPGVNALVMSAFDQAVVDGVTNPRVYEKEVWLADISEIHINSYIAMPSKAGLELTFVDMITGVGASTSWFQFAQADPVTGLAMTYQATGTSLFLNPITAISNVSASGTAGLNYVLCNSASSFTPGDYVVINFGGSSSEIRQIASIGTSPARVIFTTTLDYAHFANETIITDAKKFWCKMTVPLNVSNNTATNDYSIGLRYRARVLSKI